MIVSKSRVVIPEGDSGAVRIKPRVLQEQPQSMDPKSFPAPQVIHIAPANPVQEELLTAYIDEKSGKFSKTMQAGMIEIKYKKVTRKVSLELDSAQLQKLKELGIIVDE
jgi:hypothetical protein